MHPLLGQASTADDATSSHMDLFSAASAALCGVLVIDETGKILDSNQRICEMLGYDQLQFVGKSISEIVPTPLAARHEEHVRKFFEQPSVRVMGLGMILNAKRLDGTLLPVEISLTPVLRNRKQRVIVTVVDVSARRAMEADLRETKGYLQSLLDGLPAKIAYWDSNLLNRFANQQYREWHHLGDGKLEGRHMSEVIDAESYLASLPYVQEVLRGNIQEFERILIVNDEPRNVLVDYVPDVRESTVQGFFVLGTDITHLRKAEEALRQEKDRSQTILNSIGDGVIATDADCRVTYINPIAQQLTGWDDVSAIGLGLEEIMELRDRTSGDTVLNPLRQAVRDNRIVALATNCLLESKEGRSFVVEDSAAPIRDEDNNATGGVIVFHDVSEAHAMAARMMHFARHDSLTDLPNRLVLRDRLQHAIDQGSRDSSHFAVLFLDLDHFKDINDTFGHGIGDDLLKMVAKRLTGLLRSTDTVCRLGGDEFIILLDEVRDANEAGHVAAKILTAFEQAFTIHSPYSPLDLTTTPSIGIVIWPEDGSDADTLLRHADAAMYAAKKEGRNRSHFFSEAIEREVSARRILLAELHEALANHEFRVVYQPVVNVVSGQIVSLEALIRWQKTPSRQVAPDEFIDLVEESGLILPLGTWILREVGQQALQRSEQGLPALPVKVNISPRQFRDPNFVDHVKAVLSEMGTLSSLLELEITETSLMERLPRTTELLATLRELGIKIAIDDFGTGYSSLSYLKRLPVDALKVDRSFVKDISLDEESGAIVSAICDLAKRLRLELVAEGIERPEQVGFLFDSGCNLMQGYLFSPPVGADALNELLRSWNPQQHAVSP